MAVRDVPRHKGCSGSRRSRAACRLARCGRLDDADLRRHRHGLDLIMGYIEKGGAQLDLDTLELELAVRREASHRARTMVRP